MASSKFCANCSPADRDGQETNKLHQWQVRDCPSFLCGWSKPDRPGNSFVPQKALYGLFKLVRSRGKNPSLGWFFFRVGVENGLVPARAVAGHSGPPATPAPSDKN